MLWLGAGPGVLRLPQGGGGTWGQEVFAREQDGGRAWGNLQLPPPPKLWGGAELVRGGAAMVEVGGVW